MGTGAVDRVWLQRQVAYYRARAAEYDAGYEARMPMPTLRDAVQRLPVQGDVLELACGSGQWTPLLASKARSVTAVDAAPEMLELAQRRLPDPSVRFHEIDIFDWTPKRQYDAVFFAFWLTHIPPDRVRAFWSSVGAALRPGGSVAFLDDGYVKSELENPVGSDDGPIVRRRLADGSKHYAIKVFHTPESLSSLLATLGWDADVRMIDGYHLAGAAVPRELV